MQPIRSGQQLLAPIKTPKRTIFLSQIALYLPKRHTVLDITFLKNIKVVIKIIVLFVSYKMFLKIFFELISLEYLLTFPTLFLPKDNKIK